MRVFHFCYVCVEVDAILQALYVYTSKSCLLSSLLFIELFFLCIQFVIHSPHSPSHERITILSIIPFLFLEHVTNNLMIAMSRRKMMKILALFDITFLA